MNDLNLVLKFKAAGDTQFQFRGAARITVDGRGGLMVYDPTNHTPERIDTANLQELCIHSFARCQSSLAA
jgi:hypothetical protein